VSRVGTTGRRGRLVLDTAALTGYPHHPMNDPEVSSHRDLTDLSPTLPHFLTLSLIAAAVPAAVAVAEYDSHQ